MKIRTGFVSNSSSSSFIIGYGVIKDMDKLNAYLKKHSLTKETNRNFYHETVIITGPNDWDEHRENYEQYEHYDRHYKPIGDVKYGIGAGNDTVLYFPDELPYMKDVLFVQVNNDEGDELFNVYDDDGEWIECDYSRAFEKGFYNDWQRALIELLENNEGIFEKAEYKFGAERNG